MQSDKALISFTFDDFPRSSLHTAGRVLEDYGTRGTYYASLGLMDQVEPTGKIFTANDLTTALELGHELGCHTFAHCHAANTPAVAFENSVLENRAALRRLAPHAGFATLSYPLSCPRPSTKRRCAKHFHACRGGGQTYNSGTLDLNHLQSFFIEQSRDFPDAIKRMIDANCVAGGWLIFATHDVCESHGPYGCSPALFEAIVRYASRSGSHLVTVSSALMALGITGHPALYAGETEGSTHTL